MGAPSLHSIAVMAQPLGANEKKGMATDWWLRRGLLRVRWGAGSDPTSASATLKASASTAAVAASAVKAATWATASEALALASMWASSALALASMAAAVASA